MNTIPNYSDGVNASVLGNSQQGTQPLQQTPKEFYHGNGGVVATTPHQPPSYTYPYWGNNTITLANPSNQWQFYNPGTEAYAFANRGYHQYFHPQHDGTFPQQSYYPQPNFNAHVPTGAYNFAYPHAHPIPPTPTLPLTLSECKRKRIDSVNPSLKDVLISSPNQFQDYTSAATAPAAVSASSVTPKATTTSYPHFSFDDHLKIPNGSWNTTTNHITQQVNQLTSQTARYYDNVVNNIEPSPLSSSSNYQPFQNTYQSHSSGSFSTSTPYQELPEQRRNQGIKNSIDYSAKKAIVSPDQAKPEASNEVNSFPSSSSPFDDNNKGGVRGENTLKKDGGSNNAVDEGETGRVSGEHRRTSADRRALQSKAWYERFEDLKKYKEEHGDCLVPQKYAGNPSLGIWVNKQRMEYKLLIDNEKSSMSPDRLAALQSIGFVWAKRKGQATWDIKYQQLLEYRAQHGDCLIPTKYSKNPALGRWVSTQREHYRMWKSGDPKTKMTLQKIRMLDEIGFVWRLQF